MAKYQLVEKHAIEHHNEYFELQVGPETAHPHSFFFTTNEENLETVAAQIVAEQAPGQHWVLTPHRKV
jgi:hypothetical protein